MTAIVIGNVRSLDESPGMAEYRRRVQGTMDPFQGRFLVRGGAVHVEEGDWHPVHLSVMEFPDEERVRA